jgi:hypothetical protein
MNVGMTRMTPRIRKTPRSGIALPSIGGLGVLLVESALAILARAVDSLAGQCSES